MPADASAVAGSNSVSRWENGCLVHPKHRSSSRWCRSRRLVARGSTAKDLLQCPSRRDSFGTSRLARSRGYRSVHRDRAASRADPAVQAALPRYSHRSRRRPAPAVRPPSPIERGIEGPSGQQMTPRSRQAHLREKRTGNVGRSGTGDVRSPRFLRPAPDGTSWPQS